MEEKTASKSNRRNVPISTHCKNKTDEGRDSLCSGPFEHRPWEREGSARARGVGGERSSKDRRLNSLKSPRHENRSISVRQKHNSPKSDSIKEGKGAYQKYAPGTHQSKEHQRPGHREGWGTLGTGIVVRVTSALTDRRVGIPVLPVAG